MEIYQNVYRLKRPQTNNLIRSNPKIENNSRQSRTLLNWASSSISRSIVQRMALSGGWFDDRLHHPLGQHPAAGSTIHSIRGRANEIVLAVKFAPNALTSQWVLFINRKLKFNWCVCPWLATRWPLRQHRNLSRPRNGTIDASGLHFFSISFPFFSKRRRIKLIRSFRAT